MKIHVRLRRKSAGFKTQVAFAQALGWSQASVSRLELGQYIPKIDEAKQIAELLGCELDDVVFGKADRRAGDRRREASVDYVGEERRGTTALQRERA